MKQGRVDLLVGFLMLLAALALIFLALKVSGLAFNQEIFGGGTYDVTASFTSIGDLKIRAPVRVAGVQIGQVTHIVLDKNYNADITLNINQNINNLPADTSASILQSSLLGDNYVSLSPGYSDQVLKNHSVIVTTYAATSLESLISTFMGSSSNNSNKNSNSQGNNNSGNSSNSGDSGNPANLKLGA